MRTSHFPRQFETLLFVCAVSVIFDSPLKAEDPPAAKPSILENYKKSLPELEACYSQIEGKGAYFHMLNDPGIGTSMRTGEFEIKQNHDNVLVIINDEISRNFQRNRSRRISSIRCYTPEESFVLLKNEETKIFELAQRDNPPGRGDKISISNALEDSQGFPCNVEHLSMHFILNSDRYKLVNETPVEIDGKSLIRLRFEIKPEYHDLYMVDTRNLVWDTYYSILLSAKQPHVVHGFTRAQTGARAASPSLWNGRIEYAKSPEGVSIPRRVTYFAILTGKPGPNVTLGDGTEVKGELRNVGTYVYETYRFVEVPEKEFKLSAFGDPPPMKPRAAVKRLEKR